MASLKYVRWHKNGTLLVNSDIIHHGPFKNVTSKYKNENFRITSHDLQYTG